MIDYFNEDCMTGMARYPDKYFDLAIVDPPYGIGEDGSKNHTRCNLAKAKDYKSFSGNDKKPPDKSYFTELFRVSKNQIIWGENDFADCEIAWSSFNTAVRRLKYKWSGMLQQDMKNKETRIHPTQKPVALYRWLLTNYAHKGDKILDTHVGSASSLIACYDMGYDAVGFELDQYYYKASKKRLDEFMAQVRLDDLVKPAAQQSTIGGLS